MGCGCGKAIQYVAHGAAGLAKAALGIDRAAEDAIEQRRSICRMCPHAIRCPGNPNRKCICGACTCWLAAKTANADEHCPIEPDGTVLPKKPDGTVDCRGRCKWCRARQGLT